MNILITGGSGFIGRHMCRALSREGHGLTVLSRRPEQVGAICGASCAGIGSLERIDEHEHFDAIINLCGESIAARRWTNGRKAILKASRIDVTAGILSLIRRCASRPAVLINASAVGFYGNQGDRELVETSTAVDDFGHELCSEWENEALKAQSIGLRTSVMRIGLVIGRQGGFLKPMLLPFRLGLGGRIATGRQWMSWVHLDDLIEIIRFLLENQNLHGIFNATAPRPVTNREFTSTLARLLRRPAFMTIPGFVLSLLLGEMSGLLTGGQKVLPARLLDAGFPFRFTRLEDALRDELKPD
ncbi:MAG: TIGR01777 family oxidoreductase [Methylococcales bacterium]